MAPIRMAFLRPGIVEMEPVLSRGWILGLSLAAVGASLILRLAQADSLPGEIYGDIIAEFNYLAAIRAGQWPTNFIYSVGPLYHYLITPLAALTGMTYLGLKLVSVLVSLAVLALTYALARELAGREVALLAAFIAGVSSWLLVFSRLGHSQILLPLLTTAALYFAVRASRTGRMVDVIICAVIGALGLYAYPQTFLLPPVLFLVLLWLSRTGGALRRAHLRVFLFVAAFAAVPFVRIVADNPYEFFEGYIGGKLGVGLDVWPNLLHNASSALLAFHVQGDAVFRSNPISQPHLDLVSGVLFLVGLVYWLRPERRRLGLVLLVSFFLLQLPSILVLRFPQEVPSASRTLGVAPIAYLLVASGLWWLVQTLQHDRGPARLALVITLAVIVYLNADRYFRLYAEGLPDHNTPFGRVIAETIEALPPETTTVVVGCCWGEHGQPEPEGISYALTAPRAVSFVDPAQLSCDLLASIPRPALVIWAPQDQTMAGGLAHCLGPVSPQVRPGPHGEAVFAYAALP